MLEQVAAAFAIVGGLYGTFALIRREISSRPYRKPLWIFAGTDDVRDSLLDLNGRTVDFDSVLDFTAWSELSRRIAEETEYSRLLGSDADFLIGKRLPLYTLRDCDILDSFAYLVVEMKPDRHLKYSYGGTGVVRVLLTGRFHVEVRAYSGPSVEITLREV